MIWNDHFPGNCREKAPTFSHPRTAIIHAGHGRGPAGSRSQRSASGEKSPGLVVEPSWKIWIERIRNPIWLAKWKNLFPIYGKRNSMRKLDVPSHQHPPTCAFRPIFSPCLSTPPLNSLGSPIPGGKPRPAEAARAERFEPGGDWSGSFHGCMEVSSTENGGTPISGWLNELYGKIMENPLFCMDDYIWGHPNFRTPPFGNDFSEDNQSWIYPNKIGGFPGSMFKPDNSLDHSRHLVGQTVSFLIVHSRK